MVFARQRLPWRNNAMAFRWLRARWTIRREEFWRGLPVRMDPAAQQKDVHMTANCNHEFHCNVRVAILSDKPGNGLVEVDGKCAHCGVPLIFYGPRGVGNSPMASADRTELRAPVTFGYEPKFIPGIEFRINGPELK